MITLANMYRKKRKQNFLYRIKEGKLIAHRDPNTDYTLTPMYKDGFSSPRYHCLF